MVYHLVELTDGTYYIVDASGIELRKENFGGNVIEMLELTNIRQTWQNDSDKSIKPDFEAMKESIKVLVPIGSLKQIILWCLE